MSSRLRNWSSTRISFFAFQDIITCVSGILILVTLMLAAELDQPTEWQSDETASALEAQLKQLLAAQAELDVEAEALQRALAAAQAAPAPEKLEADLTRLREELEALRQKEAAGADAAAKARAALEERDRALGLTDLKARISDAAREARELEAKYAALRQEMGRLETRLAATQAKLLQLKAREGQLWLIPDQRATTKEPLLVTLSGRGGVIERFDRPAERIACTAAEASSALRQALANLKPANQYVVFMLRPSGIELFKELKSVALQKGFEVGFDALAEGQEVHFTSPPKFDEPPPPAASAGTAAAGSPPAAAAPPTVAPTAPTAPPPARATATNQTPATASPPPPPSKKSWWRRLLEWVGLA